MGRQKTAMSRNRGDTLAEEHRPEAIAKRLRTPARQSLVSDAVLGGIDGCVTTFAVVSGVVGAGFSPLVAVVLGFANLIADGFSMAVSNYEAIKASKELEQSVRASEYEHIEKIPAGEREEIRQIFRNKGFSGEVLETIVDTISADRHLWVETMLTEEHGIQKVSRDPFMSGLATFASFILVGAVPLVPLLVPQLVQNWQFAMSAVLAGVMFFTIGAMKSRFVSKPVFRSGIATLMTGGTAACLAFGAGYVMREVFGVVAG